ncbi:MAG: DegV family protein [Anaeroplasma sp.]
MKTKILVCSSSGISDISSSNNIAIIPNIIEFSSDEKYLEYIELLPAAFFNRMSIDQAQNPNVTFVGKEYILNNINHYISLGYDQFLFIITNAIFNYSNIISSIMDEIKVKYYIYDSSIISYPLSYVVLEAEKKLKKCDNINEIIKELDAITYDSNIYFFSPTKDDYYNLFDNDINFSGKVYKYANDSFNLLKTSKNAFTYFLNSFYNDVQYNDFIPFIIYTHESSKYFKYIKKCIMDLFPNIKKIDSYQLAPSLAVKYGYNLYGIGYIIK